MSEPQESPKAEAGKPGAEKPPQPEATGTGRVTLAEVLPTDRVSFEKQLRLLEAYAVASAQGTKPVSAEEVAKLADVHPSTASLANAFFLKMGFLERAGRELKPTKPVLDYKLATEWNRDTAGEKLLPLIQQSWCASALVRLQMGPMNKSEVIETLAQQAGAPKSHRQQVLNLASYLVATGFMREDGDNYLSGKRVVAPVAAKPEEKKADPDQDAPEGDYELIEVKVGSHVLAKLFVSKGMDPDSFSFVWGKLTTATADKMPQKKP